MIYFDNAATGGFKIHAVTEAVYSAVKYLNANPGRSGHSLAISGAKKVEETRLIVSDFFSCSPERVIFTKNCTEALNIAIFGSLSLGRHVITTVFEHNSVLRPLFYLKEKGLITLSIVSPSQNKSLLQAIEEAITDKTYLIVCTSISNVTGEVFPISEIGEIAKKRNLKFIVDGAQGGGHVKLKLKKQKISALALASHKGLGGIMGSGLLLIDDDFDLNPLIYGGTGTDTFNLTKSLPYPERLEAGTLNLPAISALKEGVAYVKNNLYFISKTLLNYTERIIEGLKNIDKISLYSNPNPAGIVSFSLKDLSSENLAYILDKEYDIAVRGAFHCAPLTHKFLATEKEGLVRVSLSVHNSLSEIDYFIRAINKISKG